MKLTIKIQLLPDKDQDLILKATMERFNEAANWLSGELFHLGIFNKIEAQQLFYREIKDRFGLTAQTVILCIHRVVEACKRSKTNQPKFGKHSAITYDPRVMSFKGIDRVSLWVIGGRILIPFIMGGYQAERIGRHKGQCDLVLGSDGKWFLMVTIDVPDGTPIDPTDFVGVDLGIINLATDSDGKHHTGADVEKVRKKHNRQRKGLARKGTKDAHKKMKRVGNKEARFRRHENHVISKKIVNAAKRTGCGIAIEDLDGIGKRVTARGGDARNRLGSWAYAQMGSFIVYKAKLAGVAVEFVNPAYSSQTCNRCGHCERANRKSQAEFKCKACGHEAHADVNAARNHRAQALSKRCLNREPVARCHS